MSLSGNICVICAWRATCQKKFSISGSDMKCSDFVKDVSIKEEKGNEGTDAEDKQ